MLCLKAKACVAIVGRPFFARSTFLDEIPGVVTALLGVFRCDVVSGAVVVG